jgi:nucleoside-diphosphate-sugar epimerase
MTEHILITGGAGYLGSIITQHMLELGFRVTVLDNFRFGQTGLLACCHHADFDVVRGDCRSEDVLRPLVAKADVIFPLAAIVGAPACDAEPQAAQSTNVEAIRLLDRLRSKRQLVIFPMTNSGYGIGSKQEYCTEVSPLRPLSLYGRTKVQAEDLLMSSGNAISLRLATVFGVSPRMRVDLLVNYMVHQAVTEQVIVLFEPEHRRNFIHVGDVARAFEHCLANHEQAAGQIYNVGLSDCNITKAQLAEAVRRHLPQLTVLTGPVGKDPDKRDYMVSNEKIEATGYRPRYSLDQGIQELIRAYTILGKSELRNA